MVVQNHEKIIYVVDDDPAMLKSIGQLLNSLGFVTVLYASAEAFLSASTISETSNSCIVLDIQLGGMSGLELGSRLASAKQALPTIFITGNDSVSARRAALQQGCVGYFTKPFAPELLVVAIEKALVRKAGDVHPSR